MSEPADTLNPDFDFTLPGSPAPEILIGAASPLWGYFMGAAASGLTFWWMTRWAQFDNLEALFGLTGRAGATALEPVAAAAPTVFAVVDAAEQDFAAAPEVAETLAAPVEAMTAEVVPAGEDVADQVTDLTSGLTRDAAEAVTETSTAVIEAAPVAEALTAPDLPDQVVGGEAAPISPVAEVEAATAEPAKEPRRPRATPPEPRPH